MKERIAFHHTTHLDVLIYLLGFHSLGEDVLIANDVNYDFFSITVE